MTAHQQLETLLQPFLDKGLELWMEGEALRFKAPKELMNKELMTVLKANKENIIQWLVRDSEVKPELVDEYPLAYTQSAIWMLYKFAPNSPAYNTTFACTLAAGIDEAAVRQAFHALLVRHPVLRSTFCDTDAGPRQQVWSHVPMPLAIVDGSQWNEEVLQQHLDEEADASFDLQKESCLRVKLFRNTMKGDVLIATIQHVGADLWALLIVAQDIKAFYQKASAGEALSVDPVAALYRDHVQWQQSFMDSPRGKLERRFWQQQLQSAPITVSLPSDYPRPPVLQLKADVVKHTVSNTTYQAVKQFCRQQSITPFVFVQAAFQLLVHHFTKQGDFLVGTPTMGRSRKGMDQVVGDFANPVVLRANVQLHASLGAFLLGVKKTLLGAMEHQECPFPIVVQDCNPPRDSSRTPLFQLMFVWHQGNADMMPKDGFIKDVLPMSGPRGAPYDIMLAVSDLGDQFELNWTYQTSMYTRETAEAFGNITQLFMAEFLAATESSTVATILQKIESKTPIETRYSVDQADAKLQTLLQQWQQKHNQTITGLAIENAKHIARHSNLVVITEQQQQPLPVLVTLLGGHVRFDRVLENHRFRDGEFIDLAPIVLEIAPILATTPWVSMGIDLGIGKDVSQGDAIYIAAPYDAVAPYYSQLQELFTDIVLLPHLPRIAGSGELDFSALEKLALLDQQKLGQELARHEIGLDQTVVLHRQNVAPTFDENRFLADSYLNNTSNSSNSTAASNKAVVDLSQRPDAWMIGADLVPSVANVNEGSSQDVKPSHLFEALENTANRFPDKGFLFIDGKGGESLFSYAELVRDARAAAAGLAQAELKAGEILLLQMAFDRRFFALWWGAVLLGVRPLVVATPEQYSDRNGVAQKLYNVAHNFDQLVVAADAERVASSQAWLGDSKTVINADKILSNQCEPLAIKPQNSDSVAFLQLTSGSTGTPKAIQITHHGVLHHVAASAEFNHYSSNDISLNWLPFDHVVPILTTHLKDVVLGIQQIQLPTALVLAEPLLWLETLSRYRVNFSWAPNFAYQRVVDALKQPSTSESWDLSCVKILMNAGEQVLAPVVRDFSAALAPFGLHKDAVQPAFGMAEACTCMTYNNDSSHTLSIHFRTTPDPTIVDVTDEAQSSHGFVDLGAVMPGVEVRITDAQNQLVKEGVIGRMQIRGPVITPGYLNNPDANEEAFVGDGWFNSGDLGFIWNKRLILTGREKEMIVVNGANYYCFELEQVVANLPGVVPTFVAATGVSTGSGQNSDELVLFYVAEEGVDQRDLESAVRTRINEAFSVTPRYVIPVTQDTFYKTTSGKIQRGQFKKLFESGFYGKQLSEFNHRHSEREPLPDTIFGYHWLVQPVEERSDRSQCSKWIDCTGLLHGASSDSDAHSSVLANIEQVLKQNQESDLEHSHTITLQLGAFTASDLNQDLFRVTQQLAAIAEILKAHTHQKIVLTLQAENRDALVLLKPLFETLIQETGNEQVRCVITPLSPSEPIIAYYPIQGTVVWQDEAGHHRLLLSSVAENAVPNSVINRNGVYLITGGLGGLAEPLCEFLITQNKARVLLSGRRPLEGEPQLQSRFNRLQSQFGQNNLAYVCLPDWKANTLETSLASSLGKLKAQQVDGVFHLAGSMAMQALGDVTQAHWQSVLNAKVEGSLALSNYLQSHAPKSVFVQYGSLNSFFGGQAAAAYSAANAVQSHLAEQLNAHSTIKSWCLNWSVWQGAGMAKAFSHAEIQMAKNKGFVPLQQSRDSWLIGRLLQMPAANYFIGLDAGNGALQPQLHWFHRCYHDIQVFIDTSAQTQPIELSAERFLINGHALIQDPTVSLQQCEDPFPRSPAGLVAIDELVLQGAQQDQSKVEPETELESKIAEIWSDVLNRTVDDVSRSFFEYGGHSINATQVVAAMNNKLNLPITVAQLFQYPTIRQLAENSASTSEQQLSLTLNDCIARADRYRIDAINPEQSSKTRLVFLPTATGLPNVYGQMAATLNDVGSFAVSMPITETQDPPLPHSAKQIAQLMVENDLVGEDVALIGWSMAGVLGYEVLCCLQQMQQPLPRLVMLDSGFAEGLHDITFDEAFQRLMFAVELGLSVDKYADFNQQISHNKKLQWLQQYLESIGIEVTADLLLKWWQAYDNRLKNLLTYQADSELVAAQITQIKAAHHTHGRDDLGWQDANNVIKWKSVSADHQGIVKSPETITCIRELL